MRRWKLAHAASRFFRAIRSLVRTGHTVHSAFRAGRALGPDTHHPPIYNSLYDPSMSPLIDQKRSI